MPTDQTQDPNPQPSTDVSTSNTGTTASTVAPPKIVQKIRAVRKHEWGKAAIISSLIVFLDVLIFYIGTVNSLNVAWCVGSIGFITFFGILLMVNYMSESRNFDQGEFRKAIAGSFMVMYFALIALLSFSDDHKTEGADLNETIIQHFTYLVGIIIVFYFGSSSVNDYMNKKSQGNQQQTNQEPYQGAGGQQGQQQV